MNQPKNMKNSALPDDPAALIRLALDDLEKCDRDSRYGIWMGDWHRGGKPDASGGVRRPCEVCLGGAVIAQSLGMPWTESVHILGLPEHVARKLEALDHFRTGNVYGALMALGWPQDDCEGGLAYAQFQLGQWGHATTLDDQGDEVDGLADWPEWVEAMKIVAEALDLYRTEVREGEVQGVPA